MSLITSLRLDLVPLTPDFLRASLAGDRGMCTAILGAAMPLEWPEPGYRDVLAMRLDELQADPALQPWLMRAMVDRASRAMVGDIGFHTAPAPEYLQPYSPKAVELGFGVCAPYRRRGYAHEAVDAMMQWAHGQHGVTEFIVSIRPDNIASHALAVRLGFVKISSHVDEVDGVEDILELRLDDAARICT